MDCAKFNEVIIKVVEQAVPNLPKTERIRNTADGSGGCSVSKHGQKGLNYSLRDERKWISLNS